MLFEVTFDGIVKTVRTLPELWTALHIDDEEYAGCWFGIVTKLLVFGEIDLSAVYNGHTVMVRLIGGE